MAGGAARPIGAGRRHPHLSRGGEHLRRSAPRSTAPLQTKLVAEMRGRIKEDDSSVPSPDGAFEYFTKFREGGQHEMIGRSRRGGSDTRILLDGDALAAQSDYFRFGGAQHSTNHKLQAWSADVKGSEYFTIRVRDWESGEDIADIVEQTSGDMVWNADFTALLLRQARRQPSSAAGLSPPHRHAAVRGQADLRGEGHRLVHPHPRERESPFLRHRRRRP